MTLKLGNVNEVVEANNDDDDNDDDDDDIRGEQR